MGVIEITIALRPTTPGGTVPRNTWVAAEARSNTVTTNRLRLQHTCV